MPLPPPYRHEDEEVARAHELWSWAQQRGADLLALNLQYILRESRIATILVGARSCEEIEADVKAIQTPIPDGTWEELKHRFGIDG